MHELYVSSINSISLVKGKCKCEGLYLSTHIYASQKKSINNGNLIKKCAHRFGFVCERNKKKPVFFIKFVLIIHSFILDTFTKIFRVKWSKKTYLSFHSWNIVINNP